ncbi:hypothetical protein [Thalassotalea sp. PS06]|uniref:hypothetical protein n=1 Tax=Thalassotalea sp. PS06 TaxID=2594005 RepID=UPI001161F7A5|nr:hypothetical protein [Thalassotalea sp. PS06]QDP01984.1 hypothetical protein FNC98_11910 [Thalassotalea sp. PS06]
MNKYTVGPPPKEVALLLTQELYSLNTVIGLFYAGSAALDELLYTQERKLISDIEIGVYISSFKQFRKIKSIEKKLRKKFSFDIELFCVSKNRYELGTVQNGSRIKSHVNLLMFDIYNSAKWIFMKEEAHPPGEFLDSRNIDLWEAVKLVLNRYGESLQYFEDLSELSSLNEQQYRWVTKCYLAVGDAFLISKGMYVSGYRNRAKCWEQLKNDNISSNLNIPNILSAYRVRLDNSGVFFNGSSESFVEDIKNAIILILNVNKDTFYKNYRVILAEHHKARRVMFHNRFMDFFVILRSIIFRLQEKKLSRILYYRLKKAEF